jgi:hypothetical protein
MNQREKRIVAYSLLAVVIWLFILIGVLLDYIGTIIGLQGAETTIMLFGISASASEWYQNLFLVGLISILLPTSILVGYIGGSYDLDIKIVALIIICALGVGSALWDLIYMYLYPLPTEAFYWWFDPFLTVFKFEQGIILMDAGFMRFFSYLRLLIFIPALCYILWREY